MQILDGDSVVHALKFNKDDKRCNRNHKNNNKDDRDKVAWRERKQRNELMSKTQERFFLNRKMANNIMASRVRENKKSPSLENLERVEDFDSQVIINKNVNSSQNIVD